MLFGALLQTSQRPGDGFDRLSPNGSFFARWFQPLSGLGTRLFKQNTPSFENSTPPFGLSLSKPSRDSRQP